MPSTYNKLLRAMRALGERGFALLVGRWRVLQHVTASPRRIGQFAKAALVLTHSSTDTYLGEITSVVYAGHDGEAGDRRPGAGPARRRGLCGRDGTRWSSRPAT